MKHLKISFFKYIFLLKPQYMYINIYHTLTKYYIILYISIVHAARRKNPGATGKLYIPCVVYSFSLFRLFLCPAFFIKLRPCSFQERNGEDWRRKTEGPTSKRPRGSGSYTCKNIRITSTGRGVESTRNGHPVHHPRLPRRPTPRATGLTLPARRFIIPCKSILVHTFR